jgi:hypothetical protein
VKAVSVIFDMCYFDEILSFFYTQILIVSDFLPEI